MRMKTVLLIVSIYLVLSCGTVNLNDGQSIINSNQSDEMFDGLKGDVKSIEYFDYYDNGNLSEQSITFYNNQGNKDSVLHLNKRNEICMSWYYILDSTERRLKCYNKVGEVNYLMEGCNYLIDDTKKVLVDYYLRPESKEKDGVVTLYYNDSGQLVKTLDSNSYKFSITKYTYSENYINSTLSITNSKDSILTIYKDGVEEKAQLLL